MAQKLWFFEAVDTLFFRGSIPFNAGEAASSAVQSNFPPNMTTLQGAIRASLAAGRGWSPQKREAWPKELGDSANLGQLELRGPYLSINEQFIYPMPATILQAGEDYTRLVPGLEAISTDMGKVNLPEVQGDVNGVKNLEEYWLSAEGINSILAGNIPAKESVIKPEEIWRSEGRIGIKRDPSTRTAERGQLYSIAHARPLAGVRLGVLVSGVPEDWHDNVQRLIPLGGEGRVVAAEITEPDNVLPKRPNLQCDGGKLRFTVTLLTPAKAADVKTFITSGPLAEFKCMSACVPKLKQLGGWDVKNRCPRPLMPIIPQGSTWFYEVEENNMSAVQQLHGSFVGIDTNYGFGQIIIGRWEEKQ